MLNIPKKAKIFLQFLIKYFNLEYFQDRVIRYLYIQNPTWSPSHIYREICEAYGDRIVSTNCEKMDTHMQGGVYQHYQRRLRGKTYDAHNTDTIAGIRALLEDGCRLTVRQLELLMRDEMMNKVGRSTIWRIICDDLYLRKVAARWVPRNLKEKLKGQCMETAINYLQTFWIT